MNNNRLSNSPNREKAGSLVNRDQLQVDISELLSRSSNYEIRGGKTYIKSLNRLKGSPTSKGVELRDLISGDLIESFVSIAECAKYLNSIPQTTRGRALKGTPFKFNGKSVYITFIKEMSN
jgi:hypothetical protein